MKARLHACAQIRTGEQERFHDWQREGGDKATGNQVQKENTTEGDATKDMGSSGRTRGSQQSGRRNSSIIQESDRLNTAEQAGIRTPRSLRDSWQVRRVLSGWGQGGSGCQRGRAKKHG